MNLENLLTLNEDIKTQKEIEQVFFDKKLQELKQYQVDTMKRKDEVCNKLFPSEIYSLIQNIAPEANKNILIRIGSEQQLAIWQREGILRFRIDNDCTFLLGIKNQYSEIFDWWSKSTYRLSHMVRRSEELNFDNKMLNLIEENIELIYQMIAERVQQKRETEESNNICCMKQLNRKTIVEKQVIKITIKIVK